MVYRHCSVRPRLGEGRGLDRPGGVSTPAMPGYSSIIHALVLLALVHPLAAAQPWSWCGDGSYYSAGSPYETNLLSLLLDTLRHNASSSPSLFASGSLGALSGPDAVWGLVICRGDVSASACYDCVTSAGRDVATACNRSREVGLFYDRCYVRLSNNGNFLVPLSISGLVRVQDAPRVTSNDVKRAVVELLNATVQYAVGNSLSLFATGQWVWPDPSFGNIYSAVQCAANLLPSQCQKCLQNALGQWWPTFPQSGQSARIAGPSCTMRSQLTPFYNGSAMVLLPTTASIAATRGSRTVGMVIGLVVALVAAASLAAVWFLRRRYRSRRQHKTQVKPTGQIQVIPGTSNAKHFPYEELAQATGNFNETRLLGMGTFGAVYKGTLAGIDTPVAIKKILETSSDQTKKAFHTEIRIMSRLHHRNILDLKGWCEEDKHLLLIYEMMENGSLEDHLYPKNGTMDTAVYGETDNDTRSSSHLSWATRHNIMIGIASGLAYLHSECAEAIVHRDIKPANIMLNNKFNAKLSDFGLVTQVRHTQTSRPTNDVIGTLSYIDPAYTETGKVSGQCDVYSLGVVLLEIVCGRRPSILEGSGKNNLIEMVRECDGRDGILDAADEQLRGQFDQEMEAVLRLGLRCVLPDRHNRPHTGRVRDRLTELLANRKQGSAASACYQRPSEGEFGTCNTTFPTRSQADEEAGVSCLLSG